jgi:hypothetical protein
MPKCAGIHPTAVGQPAYPVDTGDCRKLNLPAGVVLSRHQPASQVGQRRGFDGDDDGVIARGGLREVRVRRRVAPRFDDCCLHECF